MKYLELTILHLNAVDLKFNQQNLNDSWWFVISMNVHSESKRVETKQINALKSQVNIDECVKGFWVLTPRTSKPN